ncbi:MAG: pilus assembly protein PilM [Patescibacteria group bacterium]|nr:pilus assembly protein PilM [Patescibacteria group bacterium]MDE1966000.1 pilus assembly protein PilM [Patescibacteria group bacterium]
MTFSAMRFASVSFPPPRFLALPIAGVDLSTSGVKTVTLRDTWNGLELASFGNRFIPTGSVTGGEVMDRTKVIEAVRMLTKEKGITVANFGLPESKSYLFQTNVPDGPEEEIRTALEQRIDEFIPLQPADTAFDFVVLGRSEGQARVAGVGYARRFIMEMLSICEEAGVTVRAAEPETCSIARALLPHGDTSTVLIVDIGKATTKLTVVAHRVPLFATTFDVGGHALTLAVQKYFGVTEEGARKIKAERGILSAGGNEEYLAAMLSTASVIREEIGRRLEYWQTHARASGAEPVVRAVLAGGNASVRGLPEYLETALKIPVELGDVFTNLASRDAYLPPVDYQESLAYATAIGLALREYVL